MVKRSTRSKSRRKFRRPASSRKRSFSRPRRTPKTKRSRSVEPGDIFGQFASKLFQKKISSVFAQRTGFDAEFIEKRMNQLFGMLDTFSGTYKKATSKIPKEILIGLFSLFGVIAILFLIDRVPEPLRVLFASFQKLFTKPPEVVKPMIKEESEESIVQKRTAKAAEEAAAAKVEAEAAAKRADEAAKKAEEERLAEEKKLAEEAKSSKDSSLGKKLLWTVSTPIRSVKKALGIGGKEKLSQREAMSLYQARRFR